jgi:GNAT superfamily N-acetyltransferase
MSSEPRLASNADVAQLANTFAAAFVDDPMIRWPMPPTFDLEACERFFAVLVGDYIDLKVIWLLEDGLAAAAWLDPVATAKFGEYDLKTRELINPMTDDNGERYGKFWDWLGSHIGDDPCWFLDMLAVHPTRQRQGLGGALLRHGLALAERDGLPAILETSQRANVAYYQAYGFELVDEATSPDGGPPIWFMRKPA